MDDEWQIRGEKWQNAQMQVTTGGNSSGGEQKRHLQLQPQMQTRAGECGGYGQVPGGLKGGMNKCGGQQWGQQAGAAAPAAVMAGAYYMATPPFCHSFLLILLSNI
jgi:hypothetical protein